MSCHGPDLSSPPRAAPRYAKSRVVAASVGSVHEAPSSRLFSEAHEKSPLAKRMLTAIEMSGHSGVWIGGLTALISFFACDVPVRTLFSNVLLAVLVDAVLMAALKAAASQLHCGDQQALGFPSSFTSRTVLVTLLLVNHTGAFRLLKATLVAWCIAVGLTKILLGKHNLVDFLMGAVLGYLEYLLAVEPIWCSEELVSMLFNAIEEQARDLLLL